VIAAFMRRSALFIALSLSVVGAAMAKTSDIMKPDADDLQSFALWQRAIAQDDRAWVVKHSEPPLDIVACLNDRVGDKAFGDRLDRKDWSSDYDRVITAHVKKAIAEAVPEDLFRDKYLGLLLYRPGIAIWFSEPWDNDKDAKVEKYNLGQVWDWGRDTCSTVILDPRNKDYKAVPAALRGSWGIKGKCARVNDRLILTATTSQMGKDKPRPIFFEMHDGPVGAFQALDWDAEYESGHFNVDILRMNGLDLVEGWASMPSMGFYQRCKTPPKKN
jgi:hypothetical protein